jgi:predicted nucleic acid-binding protein
MIVLDASALIELLAGTAAGQRVGEHIADPDEGLHVPHLADVEVAQVLRRYVQFGELTAAEGAAAIETLHALDLIRHAHEPLLDRIWQLRANLSAYDAAYVALAEALDAPLITCDRRLSRAPAAKGLAVFVS